VYDFLVGYQYNIYSYFLTFRKTSYLKEGMKNMILYMVVVDGVIRLITTNRMYAEDTVESYDTKRYKSASIIETREGAPCYIKVG
jgi:hypothetical protein